jgi:hypothetical protein
LDGSPLAFLLELIGKFINETEHATIENCLRHVVVIILMAFRGESDKNKHMEKLAPSNAVLIMVDYLTAFDPGLTTIEKSTYMNIVTALAKKR